MSDPRSDRKKIFVVDDEPKIVRLIVANLESLGFEGHGCSQATEAVHGVARLAPDLVILDLMMPGMDGFQVLQGLREFSDVPVIILTARDQQTDKLRGFELGADDYLTKPFALEELFARVKALLRRSGLKTSAERLTHGELVVDIARHTVTVSDQVINLTYKEFSLLAWLMENMGRAYTREQLLETVWGYDYEGGTRTVDVHVQTLRTKLGSCGRYIETVRGVGYRFGE